ncbi:MAG TPA: ABATE domain-containing protein, partial [Amycolatopsis sp.]|nr:ABATE domain-containing protein [Amycolatopsis sp.]
MTPPRFRVTAQLRQLRFDAGARSLDLVATVGRRPTAHIERLDGVPRLTEWASGVGLPLLPGEATETLLEDVFHLREAIFVVVTAAMADERVPTGAATTLTGCAATGTAPTLPLTADGRLSPGPSPRTGRELLAEIARDAVDLVADPARRARLRLCDSPLCRML